MQSILFISDLLDTVIFEALSGNKDYLTRLFKDFRFVYEEIGKLQPRIVVIDSDRHESETLKLLQDLKENPTHSGIKLFIISSSLDPFFEAESFRQGAIDFVRKPISKEAFWVRINARCGNLHATGVDYKKPQSNRIKIDRDAYAVYKNDLLIPFSRKEFELLYLLSSHPGKVFTREEIFRKVWDRGDDEKDRTIDVHILRLRRKLGAQTIQTQKGIGYRFVNTEIE